MGEATSISAEPKKMPGRPRGRPRKVAAGETAPGIKSPGKANAVDRFDGAKANTVDRFPARADTKANTVDRFGDQTEGKANKVDRWPANEVVRRKVADLLPYAKNPRTHSLAQVRKIAASIQEFGWTMPVLVDEAGGLIAGHGRVLAAKQLGIVEVPAVVAVGWTDAQRRAYVIADNKLTEAGGWDEALLGEELRFLEGVGFDVELTGFGGDELDELFAPPAEKKGGRGNSKVGAAIVQFNIVFDSPEQQQKWFAFVRKLKAQFPGEPTLGARLTKFLEDLEGAAV